VLRLLRPCPLRAPALARRRRRRRLTRAAHAPGASG